MGDTCHCSQPCINAANPFAAIQRPSTPAHCGGCNRVPTHNCLMHARRWPWHKAHSVALQQGHGPIPLRVHCLHMHAHTHAHMPAHAANAQPPANTLPTRRQQRAPLTPCSGLLSRPLCTYMRAHTLRTPSSGPFRLHGLLPTRLPLFVPSRAVLRPCPRICCRRRRCLLAVCQQHV